MYEINLWDKMVLKEKIVKKFETKEEAEKFISNEWKATGLLFTWASLTGSGYNDTPPTRVMLTDEDKEIKKELDKSLTDEARKEWGVNEMRRNIDKDYEPHPEARGYKDIK